MGSSTFLRFIESDTLAAVHHGADSRTPFSASPLGLPSS
jgi:hypothetical protein